MKYREFLPDISLRPYVQCFFICETEAPVLTEDTVFASGYVEIMFNLGSGDPEKIINKGIVKEPCVQLWGQTINPFTFTSLGKHNMLGIRFFPHTAACFFGESIAVFNDQIMDLSDIAGGEVNVLCEQLMETGSLNKRVNLVEKFLLIRLSGFQNRQEKLPMINRILQELNSTDYVENIESIARRYNLSSRYLQKLLVDYSGLSPAMIRKIRRFQRSLQLLGNHQLSLTSIALDCGYYDQSHFIKDFKFFSGTLPSHFNSSQSTDLLAVSKH